MAGDQPASSGAAIVAAVNNTIERVEGCSGYLHNEGRSIAHEVRSVGIVILCISICYICTMAMDVEQRVLQVKKWLIQGLTEREIMKKQKWGISTRTLRRYVERCRDEWKAVAGDDIEEMRAKKLAELEDLKRSLEAKFRGKPSGIMAIARVEKQIIALMGLEKPVVRYITTPEDSPIQVSNTFDIDYSKLSPEALKEIVNARNKK